MPLLPSGKMHDQSSKKNEVALLLSIRGVFRTLPKMYNGAFYRTYLLAFSRSLFSQKSSIAVV